jgi:hypothetical protein
MDILIAALCGIGLAMLWQRAEPLKPVKDWTIIRLSRLYDLLAVRKLPRGPIWLLKGALGCEACLSPWMGLFSGLALGLGWLSLAALPVAFALYHLLLKPMDPQ